MNMHYIFHNQASICGRILTEDDDVYFDLESLGDVFHISSLTSVTEGRGDATTVLQKCIDKYFNYNISVVRYAASGDQNRLKALYERLGFEGWKYQDNQLMVRKMNSIKNNGTVRSA